MSGSGKLMWRVDRCGYTCVTAQDFDARAFWDDPQAPYVVPKCMVWNGCLGSDRHNPMARLGLFRKFANLKETPEKVCAFADEHGLLWGIHSYEPVSDWYAAVRQLTRTTRLYDLATAAQTAEVRDQILTSLPWMNGPPRPRRPSAEEMLNRLTAERERAERRRAGNLDRYVPETLFWEYSQAGDSWRVRFHGDLAAAAMWTVREVITLELRTQASIDLFAADYFAPETTGIGFAPHSLLGALWLQFALQVAEMRTRKVCEHCGKYFWLKAGQRQDTAYHPACRQAAYRKRKKAAQGDSQAAQ